MCFNNADGFNDKCLQLTDGKHVNQTYLKSIANEDATVPEGAQF